jgi:dephospho-CoA kinase
VITIAVTGGIGSGKSVVSEVLNVLGIPVYNTDIESKRLTVSSTAIRKALTDKFGEDLYADGRLDKARLASLIFTDRESLQFVNSVIHPVVLQDFVQWTKRVNVPVSAMESAILFESGFDKYATYTVCVVAPLDLRIKRVMARDAVSEAQVLQRIAGQLPDEYKCERADFSVYNDDIQSIIPQVEKIILEIRA